MTTRHLVSAALLVTLAAPALADGDRVAATRLPACTDGAPFLVYIVDASADDDCDATGGGTTEAPCLCLDGTYVAMLASGGGGGGYATCQEEGVSLTQRSTLNFVGSSITCSDAGGKTVCTLTDADTKITLDLGDDGGNDSTALGEIAPVNDDYGVFLESSADKLKVDVGKIPPYRQYDPDRPPASCATCDEWTGDAAALTWRWANQDSATETIEYDGALLTGDATNELHVRFTTAPANSDQTLTAKIGYVFDGANATSDSCGVIVLHGGTEGSPSNVSYLMIGDFSTDGIYFQSDSDYAPAAGATTHASVGWSLSTTQAQALHYQLRYTDSTRALLAYYSWDGRTWTALGTAVTLAADPISWGYYIRQGGYCRAEWFRLRTDAGRDSASD